MHKIEVNGDEMELLRDSVRCEWLREHDRIAQGIKRLHALPERLMTRTDVYFSAHGPTGAEKGGVRETTGKG